MGKHCKKDILISQECCYCSSLSCVKVPLNSQNSEGKAISDKNFLRVQFTQMIVVKEIKITSQKFLMGFNTDPLDIFQKCKVVYQAFETTNAMHDANDLIPCKK